jgi:trehalose 6-phosphate synthase/phosphatase
MARVRPILEQFTEGTPGARIETKSVSLAWHYRGAPPDFGARQAHDLRMLLGNALSNQPLEVLEGKKVIEVRPRGVSKAVVAHRLGGAAAGAETILAIGDDRTDEELFRALPPSSITIAVGDHPTCARFRLEDVRAVREALRSLLDDGGTPLMKRAAAAVTEAALI